MSIVKVIAGVVCVVMALLSVPFAWICFAWGVFWFKFIPAAFTIGLMAIGLFLIWKRRFPLSTAAKILITIFMSLIIAGPITLDIWIRCERHTLQNQAKEFLSLPVPEMFDTNTIDAYQARENETVLSTSRNIIKRYANNGRIRWSAAISGQFAVQHFETYSCEEAAKTNEEARLYIVECQAIIDKEWEMGFWQWIEDTIEIKKTIPEYEEEDAPNRWINQLCGTWTNAFGSMTISPNGRFSAISFNQGQTNIFAGTESFYGDDKILKVYPPQPTVTTSIIEKDFKILHLDDHSLIYEVDGQTNFMGR